MKQLEEEDKVRELQEGLKRERPKILVHPSLELRHPCVTSSGKAEDVLRKLELALIDPFSREYLGVGLSANQIGETDRVCIIRLGDYHLDLIGPSIVEHSSTMRRSTEGCLSCPDVYVTIMRWEEIVVRADNYSRPLAIKNFDLARIIAHEIDHLNGISIIDYKKIG